MHGEEDKKKKDEVEVRNVAEQLIYTAEKSVKDNADKITDDIKKGVQDKVDALKKAKEGTDLEAIKKATEELSTEISKIGEHMAKQAQEAQAAQPNTGTASEAPKEDNVRDAEFKEEPKKDEGEQK